MMRWDRGFVLLFGRLRDGRWDSELPSCFARGLRTPAPGFPWWWVLFGCFRRNSLPTVPF